jgi:hypothetical protein
MSGPCIKKRPSALWSVLPFPREISSLLLWVTAIGGGAIFPALFVLLSGHTLVWRDTAKLFQPVRTLVVESLRNFELPLWNPHEALGIPLFAQMMHGVLHPVSVLGAFLFPHAGMDIFILLYTVLAALGSATLARTLGTSRGAAAVAGLGYGLSGYVLGMGSVIQYLGAAASAPWALIGLRMAGEGRRYGIAAAAAGLAILHFAGDPEWSIVVMVLGIALATDAGGMRGLRDASVGIIVGAMLAGIQLIPTMAYLRETFRAAGLDSSDRLQWALAPWRIIEFIVPGLFGSPGAGLEKWPVFLWLGGQAQQGLEMPFIPSVYMGAGVLLLAARGLRHSRVTRILGIASLVLLWLALGTNAGAEQTTHCIPVWGKLRYAEKLVGPLVLCVSVLAAFGAERLSASLPRSWGVFAGVCGLTALSLALLAATWREVGSAFAGQAAQEAVPVLRHNLTIGLVHLGLTLLAFACLGLVALRNPRFRAQFVPAAALLVFLQSSLAAPFAMLSGDRSVLDRHPLSNLRTIGGPVRIETPIEKNYLYPAGMNQYDAQIGAQSHLGAPAYNIYSRIDQLNTYTGLRPRRLDRLLHRFFVMFGSDFPIALREYAVTHMIIKDPYSADEERIAQAARQDGVKVLENHDWGFTGWTVPHRPWAMFAGQVATASSEENALDRVVKALAREESTVVLEGAPQPRSLSDGQIGNIVRGNNRLRIEAASPGDGVLVVNDSFWPGWVATIDGREVPIWRADYLVRAVPWPAGRHVLEMIYSPPEVRIGWLVSLAGAMALIAIIAGGRRRGRPEKTVPASKPAGDPSPKEKRERHDQQPGAQVGEHPTQEVP